MFGAASVGALRAVELERYGMRGVGEIFRAYRDGELEDDDEVAVVHIPGQTFACSSEAMVNIRSTLAAAAACGVVAEATSELLVSLAKNLFYPDRSYDRVVERGRQAGVPRAELSRLSSWLRDHRTPSALTRSPCSARSVPGSTRTPVAFNLRSSFRRPCT